jgi:hypothetical protein
MRKMVITDFGKDFGCGRFSVKSCGLDFHSDNYNEIALLAMQFDEPCDGCAIAPKDCNGLDKCNISYGRRPQSASVKEDPYRAISSLRDGQMWTWPESDYGKAEVWKTGGYYILFEIPEFGGEPRFSKAYPMAAIDSLIADVNSWT